MLLNLFSLSKSNSECGDGNIYASKKHSKFDKRFDSYKKIDDLPSIKEGDMNKIIKNNLKLSQEAKKAIFRLNYMFTVTCDGKIENIKVLGDSKMLDWTNVDEVIESTSGQWKPAKKDGIEVDCVYFSKVTIVGSNY